MKLKIYSVIEKRPPIDEPLILWEIDGEDIDDFEFGEAEIAIREEEETELMTPDTVPDMIWSKASGGWDMHWDDKWSYSVVSKGE